MTLSAYGSAVAWLAPIWYERDLPLRLHVHDVEPDSRLGSPKLAPAFEAYLDAGAFDVVTVSETRECRHLSLAAGADPWTCRDCAGSGWYEATRAHYRDPLRAALENLRRRPGPWPRGLVPPATLVVELAGAGFDVPTVALALVVREAELASYATIAIERLRGRYRTAPVTRVAWTAKSDAQRAAEEAA